MATINLGRVGFVNKGTWLIGASYKINDVVDHANGTYAALQANIGQTPVLGGNSFWQEWVSNDTVMLTGDQTVAGVKSFTSGVKVDGANVTAYGKNYIINGGFNYWNYATSQTTSGYGSDDRWNNAHSGSNKTHSQVLSGDTERALFSSPYYSRTVVTSVAGAGNFCIKSQAIENITKLAGKTVTLSFWARADANKNIGFKLSQVFGTGGTPSSVVESNPQLISLTTTWQKKTITVTFPSIIGKTLGTDGVHTSFTGIYFGFDIGSTYSASYGGAIQQSGTFDIAEVKLAEGSVDTPWSPYEGEFGGEVQACARYYWAIPPAYLRAYGYGLSTNAFSYSFKLPVVMRVVPTIDYKVGTTTNCSSGAGTASQEYITLNPVITANGAFILMYNQAGQYASAEL